MIEIFRRTRRVLSSFICLIVGAAGGVEVGQFFGQVIPYLLAGNLEPVQFCKVIHLLLRWHIPYECQMTQGDFISAIYFSKNVFGFIGMLFFAQVMLHVHDHYYYLRSIKTTHRFLYYSFRHHFLEIDNPHLDAVYSLLYIPIRDIAPLLSAFVVGSVVFTIAYPFANALLSILFAIIAAFSTFNWLSIALWWLFHPHRLEWEIQDVGLIVGLFQRRKLEEEEARGRRQQTYLDLNSEEVTDEENE